MPQSFQGLNPAQLKLVMDQMKQVREQLATNAIDLVGHAGFADVGARNLAALMALIGAAQLCALTHRPLYAIFRMQCLAMANEESADVAMRKLTEMGPEMFGPDLELQRSSASKILKK